MRTITVMTQLLLFVPLAQAADVETVIAGAKQRIEMTDSRATGRLVQNDANGNRSSSVFVVKTHWFPGVLRTLLEITPAQTSAQRTTVSPGRDTRMSILFEMRPNGQDTVQIFRPNEAKGTTLPFAGWSEAVAGSALDYEDFTPVEFFWSKQALLRSAQLGTHECDVLESEAGGYERSHYSEVQTWVDRTTGYPLYVEKTVKDKGAVKEFTSLGLTQSGGVWVAKQVEVKIRGRAGSTLLIFERGSTKAHLTAKDFSLEEIKKFEDRP